MKKSIFIITLLLSTVIFSQNNALIIDGAYIVIDGGTPTRNVVVVVDQNSTNGIVRTSNGGFIHSESQYNYVKWNVGSNMGNYVFPFGVRLNAADYIPFTFNKTTGNATPLLLSTWTTNPLNIPKPTATNVGAVTNMFGTADSVVLAIDRFWDIQTSTITSADITFSYRGIENTTSNPTNNFLAQHWNGTAWDPQVGPGNLGVTLGIGTVGPVVNQNTFSPWVLTTCQESFSSQSLSICMGDSVILGGSYQTTTGAYNDTIFGGNVFGCDSIIITNLTVNPVPTTPQNLSICQGDSILLGGIYQTTAGIYYDTLQTTLSCDSIIATILTLNPVPTTPQNLSICQGDSILLGGTYQTTAGVYYDTLQTTLSCDSIIATTLTLIPVPTTPQNLSICQGDSVLLGGTYQTTAGIYYDTLQTTLSCDSIIATTLTLNLVPTTPQNLSICFGDSILLGGIFQTAAGTYYDTLQTVLGCDSILQNILNINPIITSNQNSTICQGDSILLGGNYQTTPGTYYDTLQAANGCDSILISNLLVNQKPNAPLISGNDSICPNDSLLLNAFGTGVGTINWYSDNQGNNVITTGNLLAIGQLTGGTYVYYYNETLNGCFGDMDSVIVFVSGVLAQTSPSPSSGISPLNVTFFNNSINATNYFWNFGTGDTSTLFQPTYTYTNQGTYEVMLIVTDGICYDTATVIIEVIGTSSIIVPNVFTPNNDGSNDFFKIEAENIVSLQAQIFNRWGQLLYAWEGINGGWNGRTDAGEEVPDGTYFYIIKAEGLNNEEFLKKGTLTLIR